MRGQQAQREFPLTQGFADQTELQLLQIAQAAMEHLRRAARSSRGDIARLDERDAQAAGGGVERSAHTHHTATDDDEVEFFVAEAAQASSRCDGDKSAGRSWWSFGVDTTPSLTAASGTLTRVTDATQTPARSSVRYVAAIDQGTTLTRAMIFDHAGQVVASRAVGA